jgi:hypothetical protein
MLQVFSVGSLGATAQRGFDYKTIPKRKTIAACKFDCVDDDIGIHSYDWKCSECANDATCQIMRHGKGQPAGNHDKKFLENLGTEKGSPSINRIYEQLHNAPLFSALTLIEHIDGHVGIEETTHYLHSYSSSSVQRLPKRRDFD